MTAAAGGPPTVGALVRGPAGAVGTVLSLALDPVDRRAAWLIVRTRSGTVTAVPVMAASVNAHEEVVVPFDEALLDQAPTVSGEVLDTATEHALLEHYGLEQ
jgi:hypothetical protein